jgi:Na+-driven multidrug efflux pump
MNKEISYNGILKFWFPLALMWIVMALELPVINSIVARMDNPKENLAIFGVIFSLALVIEGPIIQMLSAATAIVTHYNNYKKLLKFMHAAAALLTLIHFICAIPPVFSTIAINLLNVDPQLVPAAGRSFFIMLPWTASIGYRRMWQGLLIQNGRTVAVTLSMLLRMTVTCGVLFAGYFTGLFTGAALAAVSLTTGVMGGAFFAACFAKKTIRTLKNTNSENKAISWKKLTFFYIPLALTSFVTMANRPILTAGIGRSQNPLESLAIWPVIISFMFLFQGFPLSFQEAAISLLGKKENTRKLKKFVIFLSAFTFFFYLLIIFSPLKQLLLKTVMGLSDDLIKLAELPLIILLVLPAVTASIAWLRAINIINGTTLNLASAVFINFIVLLTSVIILNAVFNLNGAVLAAISFALSIIAEALFLVLRTGKKSKNLLKIIFR